MSLDMRKRRRFPSRPTCGADFHNPNFEPWDYACVLAGKFDSLQFNAFRKICIAIGDRSRCLDILDNARDILDSSPSITSPAGFVMSELQAAVYGRNL